jgi:hypothetical protein
VTVGILRNSAEICKTTHSSPFARYFQVKKIESFQKNHSFGGTGQHWSLQHPELPANTRVQMKSYNWVHSGSHSEENYRNELLFAMIMKINAIQ